MNESRGLNRLDIFAFYFYFELFLQLVFNYFSIRQQVRTELKEALDVWRNVVDGIATEKELHNKGTFLRDALLKRRLFANLRRNYFSVKEERAKL